MASSTDFSAPSVLLLTLMQVPSRIEEEFNAWYDTEHIAERLSVNGILSGRRWRALEGEPKYLTIYDVRDEAVFDDERYKYLRGAGVGPWTSRMRSYFFNPAFVRGVYRRVWPKHHEPTARQAHGLLVIAYDLPANVKEKFEQWHDLRFAPAVLALKGFLRARRFEAIDAQPNGLTLFELGSTTAIRSRAYAACQEQLEADTYRGLTDNLSERCFEMLFSAYAEDESV